MAGTNPVQSTTALSPPVGAYSASTGSIAVKVFDSTGAVSQNVNVKVQGPLTQTQQTTSEGCAFFPFLDVGTYAVSVIEGTGVGDQENVTPTQNTSVSVGQTASLLFNYDTAATIDETGLVELRRDAGDRHPALGRERRAPALLAVHVHERDHVALAALSVRERLPRLRRELHRQQPDRQGHQPQPLLPDARAGADRRRRGQHDRDDAAAVHAAGDRQEHDRG